MIDHSKFNAITTLIFDVDGVLTNGQILITEDGQMLRSMNTIDGQAIKYALEAGFNIVIITKGFSTGVKARLTGLGITHIYDRVKDKVEILHNFCAKMEVAKSQILYMGDDIPDLLLANEVEIFACPNDAVNDVLSKADFISSINGGEGCVRDIIERVMRIQDKWVI